MKSLVIAAVVGVGILMVPWMVDLLLRIKFPVHSSGAVLITGSVSGIGHAAALAMAQAGFTVYAGVLDEAEADQMRIDAEKEGILSSVNPVVLDVTNQDHIDKAIRTISGTGEPLIAVVNNAGLDLPAPVEFADMGSVHAQFDVNVFGTWRITKAALPLVRAAHGRIVIIGSIGGWVSAPTMAAYAGTKHALEAFADTLRMELLSQDISVSLVQPGGVKTLFLEKEITAGTALKAQLQSNFKGDRKTLELYQKFLDKGIQTRVDFLAHRGFLDMTTTATTGVIMDAILSPYPKTRYPVTGAPPGIPSSAILWVASLFPDRVKDYIFMNM